MLNNLKSLLQNYSSLYPEEILSKERMLKFLYKSSPVLSSLEDVVYSNDFRRNLKKQINLRSFRRDEFKDETTERTKIREQRQMSKNSLVSSFLKDAAWHFTASAFLLNNDKTKFLLMYSIIH